MKTNTEEKNKEILVQLLSIYGDCTITALMKLAYLSDVAFYSKHQQRISNLNFIRYYYGPFDKAVYKLVEKLLNDGLLETSSVLDGSHENNIYHYKGAIPPKTKFISRQEKTLLNKVAETLKGYGAKGLTKIAYETKPMQALKATLGGKEGLYEVLDFKKIVNES